MNHGKHVFRECAGAGYPRLFKRESQRLLFSVLGGQAIPGKCRPQPPIYPRMSICGTLKGSIQYRQTHRCPYCIRNTQRRKGRLRTHDGLVKVEVRHDDSDTGYICHGPLTGPRSREFQDTLNFRRHTLAIIEAPGRREIHHIQKTYVAELVICSLVQDILCLFRGPCNAQEGRQQGAGGCSPPFTDGCKTLGLLETFQGRQKDETSCATT